MANLRTNNLSGEQGQNAYRGSVFFGAQYTFLQLDGSSDLAFGTGDFTIEMWIKIDDDTSTNAFYDARPSGSNGDQIALFYSGSSNAVLLANNGTVRITGTTDVGKDHAWHHIALTRASGSTKLFVNGIQEGSTYSDSTDYENPADRPFIGQSGGSTNIGSATFFRGYISNVRVQKGEALYTSTFTPPTTELTANENTVLLCCQNSEDPTQEETGRTITANGMTSLVNRTDNLIKNGRFTSSATEDWTLSGGTAALGTGQSSTFGDGNHLVLTASSSYAYLKQSFTTVVGRTYLTDAQSNGGDASFISTTSSESDYVISDIRGGKSFIATQTTYHVILRASTGGGNFDTVSVHELENSVQPKVIPPYGVDAGNAFGGPIQQSTQGYMYFPTGRTEERGRGRGLYGGGVSPSGTTRISLIDIQSQGNSIRFGALTRASTLLATCSSKTRGLWGGDYPSAANTIDFVTIATNGNAQDFGDLTDARYNFSGCGNDTRGLFGGGHDPAYIDVIDFVTIASLGNATDFGNLLAGANGVTSASSPTRGLWFGGDTGSKQNVIQFVTIATTGNAQDFGDMQEVKHNTGSLSSQTRALVAGGNTGSFVDTIDFVEIATTGNGTDFGNLTQGRQGLGTASNSLRGVFAAGLTPSNTNTMDFVTIASTGDAKDFGDLDPDQTHFPEGCSDSHGGLS
tara:strand:+ start:876 stop:2933 length:2058 start_codon:yes stop_codon:yes gene_type:complete